MVFFWIVHSKKLFKRSFSEDPTWSRRKLSKYCSTHGKNPQIFGPYHFWTIEKAISLCLKLKLLDLVWFGNSSVCVCVEEGRGVMPPGHLVAAPLYILNAGLKAYLFYVEKKQCNTGTRIVSSWKSYVHKRSKHNKSLWSLTIKKFWKV